MNEIDKLKQYNLSNAEQVKIFHSQLAEIFKQFVSHNQHNNFLNKTTGDVLLSLKGKGLDDSVFSHLAAALRCGDSVKFAKYLPPENISNECLSAIKKSIEILNQQNA